MNRLLGLIPTLGVAACLSGCFALALAPMAYSLTDKPVSEEYASSSARPALFNAALVAMQVKGRVESNDRETGTIKGHVTKGFTPYTVTIFIAEKGAKRSLRINVDTKSIGGKFDLSNSDEIGKEVLNEIERQVGAKLERT